MKNSLQKISQVLLLALLLFVQTASATHDVEHQSFEHTEYCQAFVVADQVYAPGVGCFELPAFAQQSAHFILEYGFFVPQAFSLKHSRGPPLA